MSSDKDDEALIAAALNGSAHAWEKLVKRYEGKVFNHGLRLMGNRSDAMDLLQEVFLGVYRNLHRFRGDAKFSSWLFRIAHNKAVDLARRRKLFSPPGRTDESAQDSSWESLPEPIADRADEPDRRLAARQQNEAVVAMLAKLPMEQRLLVELKVFQAMTFDEIAELQSISSNTAKTRFYAALRKLKSETENTDVLSEN